MGSRAERTRGKAGAGRPQQGGGLWSKVGKAAAGRRGSSRRNSQPHWRVRWRDPQGLRRYTSPPTQEAAPEGPNLIVGSGGSD